MRGEKNDDERGGVKQTNKFPFFQKKILSWLSSTVTFCCRTAQRRLNENKKKENQKKKFSHAQCIMLLPSLVSVNSNRRPNLIDTDCNKYRRMVGFDNNALH